MREDLLKRKVVPIGSREWLDRQLRDYEPDWHNVLPVARQAAAEAAPKPPIPDALRQFLGKIGQRGRLQRCRNFARRNFRAWRRFRQSYGCNPNRVKAAPVSATPEALPYLRNNASRGGQARARKYSAEQLKAWAAMGGRAKAAKQRQASSPTHGMAGKQE